MPYLIPCTFVCTPEGISRNRCWALAGCHVGGAGDAPRLSDERGKEGKMTRVFLRTKVPREFACYRIVIIGDSETDGIDDDTLLCRWSVSCPRE